MLFHGVGRRCAVNLLDLDLPVSAPKAKRILKSFGFRIIKVDLIKEAYKCLRSSQYVSCADFQRAPQAVNCSSMIKWIYAQKGIWLPRYAIEQSEYMPVAVQREQARPGDLVFVRGYRNFYRTDPRKKIGHVGIVTRRNTVVHAANEKKGVVETEFEKFTANGGFVKRFPNLDKTLTLYCPKNRVIEWSGSFRWLILQRIKLKEIKNVTIQK